MIPALCFSLCGCVFGIERPVGQRLTGLFFARLVALLRRHHDEETFAAKRTGSQDLRGATAPCLF